MRLGLVVNPRAGVGGPAALKGSDAADAVEVARERGVLPMAGERAIAALRALHDSPTALGSTELWCWGGVMGEDVARAADLAHRVAGIPNHSRTERSDTIEAIRAFVALRCDVIVFAGGDGTARDVHDALAGRRIPVLGIPAGVKMHSGVFAVTPADAGALLVQLASGELVAVDEAPVRDLDETALARGDVRVRFHGTLTVPEAHRFLQHAKDTAGREDERLAILEIAAGIRDVADPQRVYVLGPGGTLREIKRAFGADGTLIGFDAIRGDGTILGEDLDEANLHALLTDHISGRPAPVVVVTFIAGQGILFGRGNQQLSARNLRALGAPDFTDAAASPNDGEAARLIVVATHARVLGLAGRPLRVDTSDPELDQALCAMIEIRTGYESRILYPVRGASD